MSPTTRRVVATRSLPGSAPPPKVRESTIYPLRLSGRRGMSKRLHPGPSARASYVDIRALDLGENLERQRHVSDRVCGNHRTPGGAGLRFGFLEEHCCAVVLAHAPQRSTAA
jgi:hypothetical protein